jgi:hypothetical protein
MAATIQRLVVSVGTGKRTDRGKPEETRLLGEDFELKLARMVSSFEEHGADVYPFNCLPPGCPPHSQVPYAFKIYAIEEALRQYKPETIIWADSACVAVAALEPLWEHIEREGYWFPDNFGWNCGQWTSDFALAPLEITRDQAFGIPQVAAAAYGLSFKSRKGQQFFRKLARLARNGSFCGPWVNDRGQASSDSRVLGHRHDQTACSVLAWRLGMKLTPQPKFFADNYKRGSETILEVWR